MASFSNTVWTVGSLRGFTVLVSFHLGPFTNQTVLTNYEAVSIQYNESCPCSYLIYTVCKSQLPHFYTLSHKRHGFRKGTIENKTRVLIFATNFIWKTSHSKKNSTRHCHKCIDLRVMYPLLLLYVNNPWISSTDLKKKSLNIIFHWQPSVFSQIY